MLVVVAMALVAIQSGVGFSERPGVPGGGLATKLYDIVGLFVLGGLDLGVPSGGPPWARALLWTAYFVAPVLTTGAILESILRTVRPDWWERRGLRGHLVVVGAGRMGMAYLEAVHEADPGRRILLVDLTPDLANVAEARSRIGVRFQQGDITHEATRASLRLDRAAGVVILTRRDLVNLEAATSIVEEHPVLRGRVVVHVADLTLKRTIVEQWSRSGGAGLPPDRVFNAHRIAAEHLVRNDLVEHFSSTEELDVVVLAGFGRFGQTILEVLMGEAGREVGEVVIVDLEAHKRLRQFDAGVQSRGRWRRHVVEGDLADPGTWELVVTCLQFDASDDPGAAPVYVVGSNNDELNLHTSLWLRAREPESRIVARCFHDSGFTRTLAADAGIEIIGVAGLLRTSLVRRHTHWFPSE